MDIVVPESRFQRVNSFLTDNDISRTAEEECSSSESLSSMTATREAFLGLLELDLDQWPFEFESVRVNKLWVFLLQILKRPTQIGIVIGPIVKSTLLRFRRCFGFRSRKGRRPATFEDDADVRSIDSWRDAALRQRTSDLRVVMIWIEDVLDSWSRLDRHDNQSKGRETRRAVASILSAVNGLSGVMKDDKWS